jgi:hypothetical protein
LRPARCSGSTASAAHRTPAPRATSCALGAPIDPTIFLGAVYDGERSL